ncbi:hypothetical protein A8H35_29260 [Burkholderia thailandensis]|nr:hypothetical protein WJ27_22660 [Burkholderia thailandensis]AVR06469.1 hypothetical protein A8H31_02100 [Burkholderia thailandensis]AWY62086.1 hypothetical protein A8H35_29260 [Burkholderia thailandensis]AWY64125.1 hypothetical protein A8H36_01460 [Burkholderia thailandensis]KVG21512.1 hypothetical protein WJ28_24225 [Burkholderia thailandensis]
MGRRESRRAKAYLAPMIEHPFAARRGAPRPMRGHRHDQHRFRRGRDVARDQSSDALRAH